MSVMAWSLTNKQQAEVRDHFLALDRDHDGKISLEELKDAFKKNGSASIDDDIDRAFKVLAQDHCEIHYSDFLAAMLGSRLELDDYLLRVTFKKFDQQGSSVVKAEDSTGLDAQAFRSALGSRFEGEGIESLIEEGDLNKDGLLDFAEFEKYVRSCYDERKRFILEAAGT